MPGSHAEDIVADYFESEDWADVDVDPEADVDVPPQAPDPSAS